MSDPAGDRGKTGYIGQPLPRVEDRRLITGAGRYTDDISAPGQVWAAFVRSPYPHAEIAGIDTAAAAAMPGVLAVLTGADYVADGHVGVRHRPNPAAALDHTKRAFAELVVDLPHLPFPTDRARHGGEPVAMVISETRAAAQDAAEAVEVEWRPLDAVPTIDAARAPDAPLLWEEAPGNVCVEEHEGDAARVAKLFDAAAHVVRHRFPTSRLVTAQMEPRSMLAEPDPGTGELVLTAGSQGSLRLKLCLAEALGLAPDKLHVVCPDVGGGFGTRSMVYPEMVGVTWAALKLGRAVKWTSDRSEAFLTDYQGRDLTLDAALALDAEGHILAYRVDMLGNIGAHTVAFVPISNASRILTTVYDIADVALRVRGVMTNSVPTSPFRGAGRPEAHFALERLLDMAARKIGLDRIEIRRRNMVQRAQLPYRSAMGLNYDSGDFIGNLDRVLDLSDWAGHPARRADAAARGKLSGIGVASYIESPVGDPRERVTLTVEAGGRVDLVAGTQSTGQGHETSFAQVAADLLGVPFEAVRFRGGDTRFVGIGGGSHSDRSMRLVGSLLVEASGEIVAAGRVACAEIWGVEPAEVAFEDGRFQAPGANRALSLIELADMLDEEAPARLTATKDFIGRMPAHPTGCAVCEVEIDPETGVVEIVRHSTVDDVGRPINPLIVDGQVHGGIVQGVGEALIEGCIYDPESGQLLTGSFMDYGMPRADMLPSFSVELAEDPTAGNPLAIKGGGEAGITPAIAAISNAIVDALKHHGVTHVDLPATPERVWRALQGGDADG